MLVMDNEKKDVSLFIKYIWFYTFFFVMVLMIASFGLIAEV